MSNMFARCWSLKKLNISSFDTRNVSKVGWMFYECRNLIDLNLSSFNIEKIKNVESIFYDCPKNIIEVNKIKFKKFDMVEMTKEYKGLKYEYTL